MLSKNVFASTDLAGSPQDLAGGPDPAWPFGQQGAPEPDRLRGTPTIAAGASRRPAVTTPGGEPAAPQPRVTHGGGTSRLAAICRRGSPRAEPFRRIEHPLVLAAAPSRVSDCKCDPVPFLPPVFAGSGPDLVPNNEAGRQQRVR